MLTGVRFATIAKTECKKLSMIAMIQGVYVIRRTEDLMAIFIVLFIALTANNG